MCCSLFGQLFWFPGGGIWTSLLNSQTTHSDTKSPQANPTANPPYWILVTARRSYEKLILSAHTHATIYRSCIGPHHKQIQERTHLPNSCSCKQKKPWRISSYMLTSMKPCTKYVLVLIWSTLLKFQTVGVGWNTLAQSKTTYTKITTSKSNSKPTSY